jgi:hypothetical protein
MISAPQPWCRTGHPTPWRPGFRSPFLWTVLAPFLCLPRASAVPSFVELPRFGADGATITVAWADYDLDGDPDLAVGNTNNQQNYLYRNDGNSAFTEFNAFGLKSTFALVWGDVDNDGDPDMAVGNCLGFMQLNRLVINNGDGTFAGQNQFGGTLTTSMAWADYDRDGDLDLAVGKGILGTAAQNFLYRNDGATWTEIPAFGLGQTQSVVWADFDSDGDPDLAVANGGFGFTGQSYLYINNGDGTFTERPEFGIADATSLAVGDYDNDGDLDVAVGVWNAGQCKLYVNQGDGTFVGQNQFGARDTNTCNWGDFDNDGDLDLAVGNGDFGSADQNYLYVNEGAGAFTESAQFGLGSTDAVAWADVDNDGDLDLAAGNEHTPTQNYLYVNQEDDDDALFLHLVGHRHDLGAGYSNRSAVGAKVAVYEAGFLGNPAHLLGYREIEAHGGFAAQNLIDAHFGLPGRSSVDVRIRWPGSEGTSVTQDLPGVSVPGRFTIHEGTTPTAVAQFGAAANSWLVAPNPAFEEVTISAARNKDARARLEIVDARGRIVRRLDSAEASGRSSAVWDRRDESGHPVAAGVYFAGWASDGGHPARIVVVR